MHGSVNQGVREPPTATPLNEEVWQEWLRKGRARDSRRSASRIRAVKWIAIGGLLLAGSGVWAHVATFEVAVRFVVTAGAIMALSLALKARRSAAAIVFGTVALLYNPVAPLFGFAGDWQRVALVASIVPFAVSLAWRSRTEAQHA